MPSYTTERDQHWPPMASLSVPTQFTLTQREDAKLIYEYAKPTNSPGGFF